MCGRTCVSEAKHSDRVTCEGEPVLRRGSVRGAVCLAVAVSGVSLRALAAWNGAGVPGGRASADLNDPENWTDGVINGDFRTLASNVTLRLTADHTFTNGMDFTFAYEVTHLVIEGTNTLGFGSAVLPGYTSPTRHLFLPTNTFSTVTLRRGLTLMTPPTINLWITGKGSLECEAEVTGSYAPFPAYGSGFAPKVILCNDANTFTGSISTDGDGLLFTSVADQGVSCALGTGVSLGMGNNPFYYIGSRSWRSNRRLSFTGSGARLFNNSGCGSLDFTGPLTVSPYNNTCVTLAGVSSGESRIAGGISNHVTTYTTRLVKNESGTWRLTGQNTFTGWPTDAHHVQMNGGTLIADYCDDTGGAGSNRLFLAGRTLRFYDSRLTLRGKAGAGNTTWQEFGTNTLVDFSLNVLRADGNGGDGTTVTLGELVVPDAFAFYRLERDGNAVLRASTAIPADAGTVRDVNGVLMSANGTRANLLVQDPDGRIGFAAQNGTLELVRFTDTLELTADNAARTDHVSLSADLTRTADLSFSTLTLDASANPVTLDLGGHVFQNDNTAVGRAIVINGSHPVTFRGGRHGAQSVTHIYHHGTGTLSWELTNGANAYVFAGPGFTEVTRALSNSIHVVEGTVRLTEDKNYTEGTVFLYSGGVLEIGADLDSPVGDTAFSRSNGSVAGRVSFKAGGFSAWGADRKLNFGGGGNSVMSWAYDGFGEHGKPLILSSPYADATIILPNPIQLYTTRREICVRNGSAAIDARMTGRLYGTAAPGGLIKSGDGTLELTGKQDYRDDFSVTGGGLRLGADDVFSATNSNGLVLSHAVLDPAGHGNGFDTLEVLGACVLEAGDGSAMLAFADSRHKAWEGTLTINGRLSPTTLRFGTDENGLTASQLAAISNRGASVYLDAQGYLQRIPDGTILSVR